MNNIKIYLPNILSGLRLASSPFLIYSILHSYSYASILIIIFAALSDGLDGYLARKFKTESSVGKIIDPIADKVFIISALIGFVLKEHHTHLYMLLALTLIREVLIISGYFRLKTVKSNFEISPIFSSKFNTSVLFVFFLAHIFLFYVQQLEFQNTIYFFWHPFTKGYNVCMALYQFMWLVCIIFNVWSGKSYVQFYQSVRQAS